MASARPWASSRKDVLHRMVAKCLRAGGAALRPDHCPAFLPVASRKCFGMLPTSQNRCGVFAGIGAILTRSQKTAIVRDDFIVKPVELKAVIVLLSRTNCPFTHDLYNNSHI